MRNMMIAVLGAALVLSPIGAGAQTTPAAAPPPPPPYGMSIGFEAAKKALAAAEAEAKKNNWQVAIAIVDTGGHLVAFSKIDGTQNASVGIAIGKATTANNFKRPTKALQDAIAQGGANLRLLAVKDATPLEGGVPIVVDGKIIGGIGASGVMANQDAEVAMAGANAAK
jgi:glc operon protein GlcG